MRARPGMGTGPRRAGSEQQFQRQLADAGVGAGADAAETAGADTYADVVVGLRAGEVDAVQDVEELRPEFEVGALVEDEALEDSGVPLRQAGERRLPLPTLPNAPMAGNEKDAGFR